MPRTLDATLKAALESGSFNAFIRLKLRQAVALVKKYKLTPTTLEVNYENITTGTGTGVDNTIALERGVTIGGINYTLQTSIMFIISTTVEVGPGIPFNWKVKAALFPNRYYSAPADDTYQNVITAFCAFFGKTAVFDQPSAALWQYQFFPDGKAYTTNNALSFLNLLKQKFFIFACDNGNNEVLFFQGMRNKASQYNIWFREPDPIDKEANDIVINVTSFSEIRPAFESRTYIARDETGSIRNGGTPNKIIHNLGYLESTDAFPELSTVITTGLPSTNPFLINLYPLTGDSVTLDPNFEGTPIYPAEVIEIYDQNINPSWSTTIRSIRVLSNTEGGALPSTIERIAAYTPLVTSGFNGNLGQNVNNLQALAEAVDDLLIAANLAPLNTTNFNNHLSSADNTVQKAFDTLDDISGGAFETIIEGFRLRWNSATSIDISAGKCFAENGDLIDIDTPTTKSSLSLSATTIYHVYAYLSSGTPAFEIVTTAPVAWKNTAFSKTADTSRRYLGSLLTDGSGNVYNFLHHPETGKIFYRNVQGASPFRVLSGGTATTETTVSLSAIIPTTAVFANVRLINTSDKNLWTGVSDDSASGPPSSGMIGVAPITGQISVFIDHPIDSSRAFTYWLQSAPGSGGATIDIYGYLFNR